MESSKVIFNEYANFAESILDLSKEEQYKEVNKFRDNTRIAIILTAITSKNEDTINELQKALDAINKLADLHVELIHNNQGFMIREYMNLAMEV